MPTDVLGRSQVDSNTYVYDSGLLRWVPQAPIGAGGGGAVTIADGADVVEGTLADAAVVTDIAGTVNAKLRGLVRIFADVWDDANNRLNVFIQNASIAITGTVTANVNTAGGKTITYVSVNQGAAGTTVLAAASPGNRHKLLLGMLVISATGTLKFTDGGGDLTGPMDVATNGGFVVPASGYPMLQTAVNSALSLVTTTGAARGIIGILTEA